MGHALDGASRSRKIPIARGTRLTEAYLSQRSNGSYLNKSALPALLFSWSLATASPGIYKWVDADGNLHFSDCPPSPDEKCLIEELDIDTGPALSDEELQQASDNRAEWRSELHERSGVRQDQQQEQRLERRENQALQAEFRDRQCALARENLQQLLRAEPVYLQDRSRIVRQEEDETLKDIETMRALIEQYCDD